MSAAPSHEAPNPESDIPDSAAKVLRRYSGRRMAGAIVIVVCGIALVGLGWRTVSTVSALRLRGVHTQATVTRKDRREPGWTLLEVRFRTLDGLDAEAVLLREGQVTTELVSIVYDPKDPSRVRLASDVQAGALVIEVLTGVIAFVGDSPEPDSGLTIAAIGLVVGCTGLRKLAAAATDPFPRQLRWIATHPAETQTMRLWLQKEQPKRKARLAPAEANDGEWLELDLQRGQDLGGLIGGTSGTRVEVLQGLRRDGGWCVIRVPDGRLLWPANAAVSHHPSLEVDLAAHEPTPSDGPAAATTSATPTTTATADMPSRQPSLSCLLYLSYLSTNEVLYGVTYRVNTKTIAATILAAGFLSLRDLACIELDDASPANPPESHPSGKDAVMVRPLRWVELPGIPGEILNALRPWREPVTTAADRMEDGAGVFGERMRLAVERELIALGYYRNPVQSDDHRTHRLRAVGRRLGAGYRASPRPDYPAVATLDEARAQALRRWQQFETTEPLLFRALMQACLWATKRVD